MALVSRPSARFCLGDYMEADGATESLRRWAVVYDVRSVTVLRGDLQPTRN
jgi:hypothetical protein